ncbi:hypothetical protein HS088_TW19G00200 [Tripterygium wilfordii]|uniref:Uncharacterized protein n=1 Tax=Tripterygium wilfordii TaxID=458696 RepID=A0A7J7C8Y2_TRIWF|nr:hypothetical protein HS088_TW19G00200 [Tripterygium wilfordii]
MHRTDLENSCVILLIEAMHFGTVIGAISSSQFHINVDNFPLRNTICRCSETFFCCLFYDAQLAFVVMLVPFLWQHFIVDNVDLFELRGFADTSGVATYSRRVVFRKIWLIPEFSPQFRSCINS